jgi:hypothetical protein
MDSVRRTEIPFELLVLGRGLQGDGGSHTSAQEQTFVFSLIALAGQQSTMQNFDATHANFGVHPGATDPA